jgi:hypothetical protein
MKHNHHHHHHHHHLMVLQPNLGPGLPLWAGFLVKRPTPNLEDQVPYLTPGDRVAQLYPQELGTHFGRLLRHAWVTVGLFFNPDHHTGNDTQYIQKFNNSTYYLKHGIIVNSVKNLLTTNYLAAEPVGVTTKMKIEPRTD